MAGAVFIHQQVDREIFDKEARLVLQALLVELCRIAWPVRSAAAQAR